MYSSVNPKQDFPQMEEKIIQWWYSNKIIEKYIIKNQDSKKTFSFVDGPITANNPMGLHHARGRTYKDLWQRYKNMQGYKQRFQNGFDCQGLWVEVEVEKALNFNSKKDIQNYGTANFTQACIDRVNKFSKIQTEQSKRLGMFMDWDNSYFTMSKTNNLYIWHFLKLCNEKGLLYKDNSAITWCPRCETGLSAHEQADEHKEITDKSVYVKFKILNKENEYLLAWTTTPWTLSSNVLLAISPKIQYVKAKVNNDILYLCESTAKKLKLENYTPVQTSELLGLEYESLYNDIPIQNGVKHTVVEWELVFDNEGTGIVHIAPGCGGEDFELGKKLNSALLAPLNDSGHFVEGYGDLTGKYAHDVADQVIEYLTNKKALFKVEDYTHKYPHCWRCKTKCLFRVQNNWFIKISQIRQQLKDTAQKANWMPDHVSKRMENWLDNMGDWMISRQRFYGLSLPFYECENCKKLTIVGSEKELKDLAVNPELVDKLPSLHRPYIDEIKIKCPHCQAEVQRITDVGDCWLDAGVVPFSTLKYLEDKEYWKQWYPADFICEMVEQVRLWYYSMLVYGVIFEEKSLNEVSNTDEQKTSNEPSKQLPYKNVVNYGEVRDEKGQRMSKSKPNNIPFDEVGKKSGVDLIRWFYAGQLGPQYVKFGWGILDEVRKNFYLTLWNTYGYFVTYANLHNWQANQTNSDQNILANYAKLDNLDKWILTKQNELIKSITEKLDKFESNKVIQEVEDFVQELSTWYIRRSRQRFVNGDTNCLNTLHYVLVNLSKMLAPVIPFITEEIYQNLNQIDLNSTDTKEQNEGETKSANKTQNSVHLCDYPKYQEALKNDVILETMLKVKEICSLGQAARIKAKIKIKQPLSELQIQGVQLEDELLNLIEEELNLKNVKIVDKIEQESTKTNTESETELENGNQAKNEIKNGNKTTKSTTGWEVQTNNKITIALNTTISQDLENEGLYREIVREIQHKRHYKKLNIQDKIDVTIKTQDQKIIKLINDKKQNLQKEININQIIIKEEKVEEQKGKCNFEVEV